MAKTGYVLALEDDKWYVGVTSDLDKRLADHRAGRGCTWTAEYPVKRLVRKFAVNTGKEEDAQTIAMMRRYGIDAVRGGSFCQLDLDDDVQRVLEDLVARDHVKCDDCGRRGHTSETCEAHQVVRHMQTATATGKCFRCGEPGHFARWCRASSSTDEYEYEEYYSD